MPTPSERCREQITRWFAAGAVHTFVGAGGKSTAMKTVARVLAASGARVRMTTTTRIGIGEFDGFPVRVCVTRKELLAALGDEEPVLLIVAGEAEVGEKYLGLPADLVECLPLPPRAVFLVEADGSRRLPMKAPREHEPVIPADSSTVSALMGASAFGEPVDEAHCYNHEGATSMLASHGGPAHGRSHYRFGPDEIAFLAASRDGCRKGVLPGMDYRVLVNQADLEERRPIAREAVRLMSDRFGVEGHLISFLKGELYDDGSP
jgi:molybdenum cofactor cytidylyltransferase